MSLLSTSTFAPEDEGPFYNFERYEVLKKYDGLASDIISVLVSGLVSGPDSGPILSKIDIENIESSFSWASWP